MKRERGWCSLRQELHIQAFPGNIFSVLRIKMIHRRTSSLPARAGGGCRTGTSPHKDCGEQLPDEIFIVLPANTLSFWDRLQPCRGWKWETFFRVPVSVTACEMKQPQDSLSCSCRCCRCGVRLAEIVSLMAGAGAAGSGGCAGALHPLPWHSGGCAGALHPSPWHSRALLCSCL